MKSSRGADGNRVAGLFALVLATAILLLSGGRAAATVNYTSSYVWDSDRRLTMVIEPDPGTGVHAATRYVYDADSQLIETDKGTTPNTDGSSFTVVEKTLFTFDAGGRKTLTTVLNGTATPALAVSQTD